MESSSEGVDFLGSDANLKFLKLELERIDILIRKAVHCWQLAGQDPLDAFRGLTISDQEADQLAAQPFGTSWGQTVQLAENEKNAYAQALRKVEEQAQSLLCAAQNQGRNLRLDLLQRTFGIDRFDLDVLLVCLAPALDLRYGRLFGYLQDDVTHKKPGVNLVLNLLYGPGMERLQLLPRFTHGSPLINFHLIERTNGPGDNPKNLLAQDLQIDPTIMTWLLGRYQPCPELFLHISLLHPGEELSDQLLANSLEDQLNLAEFDRYFTGEAPILVFYGPDRAGQEAAARLWAARLKRPLLRADLAGLIGSGMAPFNALSMVLRDARLVGALPYLVGWEACLASGEALSPDLLAELCAFPGMAIISGKEEWLAAGVERDRPLFWVDFPVPTYQQRLNLWKHYLDKETAARIDINALAGQFALTSGQIQDAIFTARDWAAQQGDDLSMQHLLRAARAHSNPHLGVLARKILPRYNWQDIVLPNDQLELLHEIVSTVRGRAMVLTEWGVGRKLVASSGVPVLFSGEPGTGKTMAAEVIATELGLDLYKIDLSTVVSKYIGETEKNLERIFSEAESSNAILFFDEADAIFGKRSEVKDAHDRYANIEISYLLQRMEAYDGVTILATNLRSNLDEAFTRRLQFAVDFPFPDEEHRLRIWQTLFPPEVPHDPELDFTFLARRFKLAGGSIRNILVSAAYLAASDGGCVTMTHLLHGVRRELQKMGRLVNEADVTVHQSLGKGGEHGSTTEN